MIDETEVEKMRNKAQAATNHSTKWPGMSYEEGVRDALEWVLEELEERELLP